MQDLISVTCLLINLSPFRYHVPAPVQSHIDYITPILIPVATKASSNAAFTNPRTSYPSPTAAKGADLPTFYQCQCNEYMKLGMQGIFIVVASGDSGVAGPAGHDNADGCLGPTGSILFPDFPATCPYLTTLGAVYLPPGEDVNKDQEVAVIRFPSGGGFSNVYPTPSYQANAVATYFATRNPPYPYYSSVNNNSFTRIAVSTTVWAVDMPISLLYVCASLLSRGFILIYGVLQIGDNIVIFNAGSPTLIGGTSAAAPTFSSILTRINEERLLAGKTTIGFVNPTLVSPYPIRRFHSVVSSACWEL